MKRKRVAICLVAGICILAVSATAAFSSLYGYANYKYAVKALALEAENVTAKGTYNVTFDGRSVLSGDLEYARDGQNYATFNRSKEGETVTWEHRNVVLDGVERWYSDSLGPNAAEKPKCYYETVYEEDEQMELGKGILNIANDDEFSRRLVNFMEIGADTVVGDLKNNVIELGSKDGITTYQIDVSENQVPSLVNAGLSLMAYTASESLRNVSYVAWEDYIESAIRYYEEETGETLSEEFMKYYGAEWGFDEDWWADNQKAIEKFDEVTGPLHQKYYEILEKEKNGQGILYVHVDGSYDHYPDAKAFAAKTGEADPGDFRYFIGQDLTLKNVHFTFGVDKMTQLTNNICVATFDTTDDQGNHHEVVIQAEAVFTDYGTTVIEPLDVSGRINASSENVEAFEANMIPEEADPTLVTFDSDETSDAG